MRLRLKSARVAGLVQLIYKVYRLPLGCMYDNIYRNPTPRSWSSCACCNMQLLHPLGSFEELSMNHDTFLLHEFHGRFALLIVEKISDHTTPQKIIRGPHKSFVFFKSLWPLQNSQHLLLSAPAVSLKAASPLAALLAQCDQRMQLRLQGVV